MIKAADQWTDYEILDISDGQKLERWADHILIRPDPLIVFSTCIDEKLWASANARYIRSSDGGGRWEYYKKLPDRWTVSYRELSFYISPTNFKHTGLFPEQAVNWDHFQETIIASDRTLDILNLFAYTGGATLACAKAGARVCHVDAAKGMVAWAKENAALSGLTDKPVRYIVDDCLKFVKREQRRGNKYDGIIMDPPSFGRGPGGEVWKAENDLYPFVLETVKLLSEDARFFHINSYTTGFSPVVLEDMLKLTLQKNKFGGSISCGELVLPVSKSELYLPCGIFARWQRI